MSFRKAIVAAAAVAALMNFSAARAEDAAPVPAPVAPAIAPATALTKADVERIVHDYIASHPGDILAAVQDYQDKTVRDKQEAAVKNNKKDLYGADNSPQAGNPNGDVTVVEFFDYNCGYCKKVAPQISDLIAQDKNLHVIFKDFPILGPSSETAAKWALAANKQHKYFQFFQIMMKNHAPITDDLLEQNAKLIGMDVKQAKSDMQGTEFIIQIERNRALAAAMEIHGTPAFVIGEELSPGAISVEEMKQQIAKVRAAKGKPADKTESNGAK